MKKGFPSWVDPWDTWTPYDPATPTDDEPREKAKRERGDTPALFRHLWETVEPVPAEEKKGGRKS